jgi:hypothetical protein
MANEAAEVISYYVPDYIKDGAWYWYGTTGGRDFMVFKVDSRTKNLQLIFL